MHVAVIVASIALVVVVAIICRCVVDVVDKQIAHKQHESQGMADAEAKRLREEVAEVRSELKGIRSSINLRRM